MCQICEKRRRYIRRAEKGEPKRGEPRERAEKSEPKRANETVCKEMATEQQGARCKGGHVQSATESSGSRAALCGADRGARAVATATLARRSSITADGNSAGGWRHT